MTRSLVLMILAALALAAQCQSPVCPPPTPGPVVVVVPPDGGGAAVGAPGKAPPCPNPPAPPKPPAPTPSDPYGAACANLAALGCPEGKDDLCADRMRKADQTHLTVVRVPCLTTAGSVAAARACGFVACRMP